jgi:hypothetical protein
VYGQVIANEASPRRRTKMAYILICKKLGKRDRKFLVYFDQFGSKDSTPFGVKVYDNSIEAQADITRGRPKILTDEKVEVAEISDELVADLSRFYVGCDIDSPAQALDDLNDRLISQLHI